MGYYQPYNYPGAGQDYELTYPDIYPIYDPLEHMKGLVLQVQRYRISTT